MRCSVVMPCYQNQRTLLACLQSFTVRQKERPCEVVIVDDGSTPSPSADITAYAAASPVPVRALVTARRGQSGATNHGLRAAVGEVVLLSCADIVASPTLVAEHMAAHRQAQRQRQALGVGGPIRYAPWIKMTPFMRYLAGPGPQFDFTGLTDGGPLAPNRLYAPNFSARRQDLLAVGGFDEGFPYGFQDTDLGLRLHARGVILRYAAKGVALHDHPTTFVDFLRRNRKVGAYLPRMLQRYPDADMLARCRDSVRDLVPLLHRLPELVAAAEAAAAQVPKTRGAAAAALQQLSALYSRALGMALLEGVLSCGDGAAEALGYDAASWQAALARRQCAESGDNAATAC